MKNIILLALALILIGAGLYVFTQTQDSENGKPDDRGGIDTIQPPAAEQPDDTQDTSEPETVVGTSVQGRNITAYHYGEGAEELLFVGGMHGGYEWNTVLLAYELMDYLEATPGRIPANVRVTVIPVLNPDGLQKVVGTAGRFTQANVPAFTEATVPGRFNANNVDLNRNFDCGWQPTGKWQDRTVDAGASAFSEPESQAFRDYIQSANPAAVVVWYSAAGGVFLSECGSGASSETRAIAKAYGQAAGYPVYEKFDFYEITGDAANWLAKNNIPAMSVLLSTHEDVEWDKNRAGIETLFDYYGE